jgi:hypothetical protein
MTASLLQDVCACVCSSSDTLQLGPLLISYDVCLQHGTWFALPKATKE